MSMEKHTDYKLIGIAAADTLKMYGCTVALINMDDMSAAVIDVTDKGDCNVKDLYQGSPKADFYQTAAESLGSFEVADLFELCKTSTKSFVRYIKTDGASDEQLLDDLYCKTLVQIYDEGYKQSVEQLINAVKLIVSENTKIVLVGRLAAFYPAEHTIKKVLTPMAFLPLETLVLNYELCTDGSELISKGQAILERLEKEKKNICRNIMLRYKRLSGTELGDGLFILAKKGDEFESLKNPKYSDVIIVHALDPIVILADGVQYTMNFPRTLFSRGAVMSKVQFALGIENDIPKLIVKDADNITMLEIDAKIYSEE